MIRQQAREGGGIKNTSDKKDTLDSSKLKSFVL